MKYLRSIVLVFSVLFAILLIGREVLAEDLSVGQVEEVKEPTIIIKSSLEVISLKRMELRGIYSSTVQNIRSTFRELRELKQESMGG